MPVAVSHTHLTAVPVYSVQITFAYTSSAFMAPFLVPSAGDWSIPRVGTLCVPRRRAATCFFTCSPTGPRPPLLVLFVLRPSPFRQANGTSNLSVTFCRFMSVGGNGVYVAGFANNTVIDNNEFVWVGASAAVVHGDPLYDTSKPWDLTAGILPYYTRFTNNVAHELGVYVKETAGYFQAMAAFSTVTGNIIFNGPRSGLNANDNGLGGHLFEDNLLFNLVRETVCRFTLRCAPWCVCSLLTAHCSLLTARGLWRGAGGPRPVQFVGPSAVPFHVAARRAQRPRRAASRPHIHAGHVLRVTEPDFRSVRWHQVSGPRRRQVRAGSCVRRPQTRQALVYGAVRLCASGFYHDVANVALYGSIKLKGEHVSCQDTVVLYPAWGNVCMHQVVPILSEGGLQYTNNTCVWNGTAPYALSGPCDSGNLLLDNNTFATQTTAQHVTVECDRVKRDWSQWQAAGHDGGSELRNTLPDTDTMLQWCRDALGF